MRRARSATLMLCGLAVVSAGCSGGKHADGHSAPDYPAPPMSLCQDLQKPGWTQNIDPSFTHDLDETDLECYYQLSDGQLAFLEVRTTSHRLTRSTYALASKDAVRDGTVGPKPTTTRLQHGVRYEGIGQPNSALAQISLVADRNLFIRLTVIDRKGVGSAAATKTSDYLVASVEHALR